MHVTVPKRKIKSYVIDDDMQATKKLLNHIPGNHQPGLFVYNISPDQKLFLDRYFEPIL